MKVDEVNEIMLPCEASYVNEMLTIIKQNTLVEYSKLLDRMEEIHKNSNDAFLAKLTFLLRMLEGCDLVRAKVVSETRTNYTLTLEGYVAQSKGIIRYTQDISKAKNIQVTANIWTARASVSQIICGILGGIIGVLGSLIIK